MRKIIIDFGAMYLVNASIKHRSLCGEYQFELYKDGCYLATLDMKEYKLVKSKRIDDLYKLERR